MLAPATVRRLLFGEAMQNFRSQLLPFFIGEDASGEVHRGCPKGKMVRRSTDERRIVKRIILAFGCVGSQLEEVDHQPALPAFAALIAQITLEQPVRLEPHVSVTVMIEARVVGSGL